MAREPTWGDPEGPFSPHQLRPGDRYELDHGHPVRCAPTGGDGARNALLGGQVLNSDPDVTEAGFDAGFVPSAKSMRAPDIAVGNVPDRPGWIQGVPPLAVEYASVGQDEAALATKIAEFLGLGTRWIWVVRLDTPRRVEVHTPDAPMVVHGIGDTLTAPGVLRNPVPVEALFDRRVANEVTLSNLLQQHGFASLGAVEAKGREEGREEGREAGREEGREEGREAGREAGELTARRALLRKAFELRFGPLTNVLSQALDALPRERLDEVFTRALTEASAEDALAP